jgi:hypothetical protein
MWALKRVVAGVHDRPMYTVKPRRAQYSRCKFWRNTVGFIELGKVLTIGLFICIWGAKAALVQVIK